MGQTPCIHNKCRQTILSPKWDNSDPTLPLPLPYPTLPYPTLPYPTLALPCLALPLPYPTLPTLPYPTLPYPTLPYPTLPYPNPNLPPTLPLPYPTPTLALHVPCYTQPYPTPYSSLTIPYPHAYPTPTIPCPINMASFPFKMAFYLIWIGTGTVRVFLSLTSDRYVQCSRVGLEVKIYDALAGGIRASHGTFSSF